MKKGHPLLEQIRSFPDGPGVYIFKNARGKPLYIGKATSLRQRVRSYFTGHDSRPMIPHLLQDAVDIECISTPNPLEALILEAHLIRRFRPRYNTLLKDTRHLPYVKITTDEPFPRIHIIFQPGSEDGREFGPFRSIGHARKWINLIAQLFKLRQCKLELKPEGNTFPVCLLFHIGRCSGPCDNRITRDAYRENVQQALDFLSGEREKVLHDLRTRMIESAREQRFEEAIQYRDKIREIENWTASMTVIDEHRRNIDAWCWVRGEHEHTLVVTRIRLGIWTDQKVFSFLPHTIESNKSDWWEQILTQFYQTVSQMPHAIWLACPVQKLPHFERWLEYHFKQRVPVVYSASHLSTDADRQLYEWFVKNARVYHTTHAHESTHRISKILRNLQAYLHLAELPIRIEGIDISNIQGKWNVGSIVVCQWGRCLRKEYRVITIQSVKGANDPACIREVVYRRLTGRLSRSFPLPDLILIDGGKTQLQSACEALREAGVSGVSVVSIAKKEELIFHPDFPEPLRLPFQSPELQLLRRIRDEAHRTALRAYRKKHRKHLRKRFLIEAPGIGEKLAWRIIQRYPTIRELLRASEEELVQFIGKKRGSALFQWLHSRKNNLS